MDYKIGDKIWNAECGSQLIKKTCPICNGDKVVTLILGNKDRMTLPCDYCGKGFESPKGFVEEYEYRAEPKPRVITRIEVEVTSDGENRKYCSGYHLLNSDKMFLNREDSLAKCNEVKMKLEHDKETLAKHIKENTNKSYSWNAGYHMRAVKRAERELEYHKKMAVICKAKGKEK